MAYDSGHHKYYYPNGTVWDRSCAEDLGYRAPWESPSRPPHGMVIPRSVWPMAARSLRQRTVDSFATKIIDPYGQETDITLGSNGLITQVTEPGGRYLHFTYDGSFLLTQVDAYDGQGNRIDYVVYHYTAIRPAEGGTIGARVSCLTSVDYSDGTHAYYAYQDDNVPDHPNQPCPCSSKIYPLLRTCQDVRYNGPMRHICYEYQDQGPHGAIIAERVQPQRQHNGPRVSRIDHLPRRRS